MSFPLEVEAITEVTVPKAVVVAGMTVADLGVTGDVPCCLARTETALKKRGELSKMPGTIEYGIGRTGASGAGFGRSRKKKKRNEKNDKKL